MVGQGRDGRRKLQGDACADDDDGHAGQHGAIEGGQVRQLDLFEEIDADGMGVAFASQENLDEIGGDAQFLGREVAGHRVLAGGFIARAGTASARNKVCIENLAGDAGKGKVLQRAADMAFAVAILKTAREDLIEGGAGHDPELPQPGNRPGQPPVRDTGPHAALDELRN
jgi:hypothetical protein